MGRVYLPPGFTLYQADQPLAQIEIPDASVTTAKLADGSVTPAKHSSAKEFFTPVTFALNGVMTASYRPVAQCNAADEQGHMAFQVPPDFTNIAEAVVVVIPRATKAAADWDIRSAYAAVGEAYQLHNEADATTTYNVTSAQLFEVDISGILTGIAAGDNVGVILEQTGVADHVDIVGVRFRYT